MTENDFERFREGLAGVYGFYSKDLSQFAMDTWWRAMKPFSLDAITDAFNRHVVNPDNGKWMPMPADIIQMLQGSSMDSAMTAWTKTDKALRSVGTYKSVVFDDPLIHKIIQDMGGWIAFGMKNEEEWPFVAKEFQNRYRGFKSRSMTPEYPSHLTGLAEGHNSKEGYRIDPPKFIGDIEKAKQVMNGGVGLVEFNESIGLKPMQKDVEKAVGSMSMLAKKEASA